ALPPVRTSSLSASATLSRSLAKLVHRESMPILRDALTAGKPLVEEQAAQALNALGDPEGRAYLEAREGLVGSFGAYAGALLAMRSAERTSELPSREILICRL